MERTVIALSRFGNGVQASVERSPLDLDFDTVDLPIDAMNAVGLIERGGELSALLQAKDPVKAGFEALLRSPVGSPPSPLYFHIRSPIADAIAWEALHALPIGFLALDRRCPVGRIADREINVPGRFFRPPLRVTAVLSAAGCDGHAQLQALRDALAGAGIPVELRIISGDQDLIDQLAGTEVRAELIADDAGALCRQLASSTPPPATPTPPHIIHLLCHGRMQAGVSSLAFGSVPDMDPREAQGAAAPAQPNAEPGSINVSVAQLVTELQAANPWLVVLAACQTGEVGEAAGTRPFAHELVRSGLTAAIGMRRIVNLSDTDRFCKLLYPGIVAAIKEVVDPPGRGEQILDWAATLTAPRQAISGADPAVADAWTDPVLYVQSDPLRVIAEGGAGALPPAESARLLGELDTYRNYLARRDPDPAMVASIEAKIAHIQQQLRGEGVPEDGRPAD